MKNIIKKGDKYNRLVAIELKGRNKHGSQFWLFKCDCGNEKVIKVDSVKNSSTKSCGCLNSELYIKLNRTHGMARTRIYHSWVNMKHRCLNDKYYRYKDYGGRGITVCKDWLKFENFYRDMRDRPERKTLDRIDNDGNYCKKNCRWATVIEQNNNQRPNIRNIHNKNSSSTG